VGKGVSMTREKITALIAAGGKGTRLGEITKDIPKPLVEVAGKPIMGHVIDNLETAGITDVAIRVAHQKQQIIDYASGRYRIVDNGTESLFPPIIQLTGECESEYILGLNGDTLIHEDSIQQVVKLADEFPEADALVLNTMVTRPSPEATWTYWRHNFSNSRLVALDEVPGSKLDSECLALLFKRTSIIKAQSQLQTFIEHPESVPFKNFGVGWNHIIRLFLWQGLDVRGHVADDLILNINKPDELGEAQLFFDDPAQFRFKRLTPRNGTIPIMSETSLITVSPVNEVQNAVREAQSMGMNVTHQDILETNANGGGHSVGILEINGPGAYYRSQQLVETLARGNVGAETVKSRNSFDRERDKMKEQLYCNLPIIRNK